MKQLDHSHVPDLVDHQQITVKFLYLTGMKKVVDNLTEISFSVQMMKVQGMGVGVGVGEVISFMKMSLLKLDMW